MKFSSLERVLRLKKAHSPVDAWAADGLAWTFDLGACKGLGDLGASGTEDNGLGGWSNVSTRVPGGACSRVSSRVFVFLLCLELKTRTIRSRIKLSRKQSQKLHVLARFLNSATKLSIDSVGSLSLILKQYRSQILLTSPMQCFSIFPITMRQSLEFTPSA